MTATGSVVFETMNPLSGGTTVSMPDGKGGSISLDKEGNAEHLKFWKNAAENTAGTTKSPYDHRIFSQLLTEKDLKQHESWLKASKIIYDMEHYPGAWDERVVVKGWNAEKAKAELGSYGINYGAELFFQDSKAIWGTNGRTEEQKLALRYLKDAYDHKDWNAASFTRAAWKSFSDPLNLGLMAVAAVAAPITGGASFIILGIGKKGAIESGKAAFKTVMTKFGRDTIVKEAGEKAAKEASEKLTTRIAKDFAAKPAAHTAGKTLFGTAGNAALLSGLSGLATEDAFQDIEIAGAAALGQTQEYSRLRTVGTGLTSAAVGAGIGVALTVPVRPTVEAISDLVFDPIRNMKFLKPLAKEKNAENAFENAIKAKGKEAYDNEFSTLSKTGSSEKDARKSADQKKNVAEETERVSEVQKRADFEQYAKDLDATAKKAIEAAGRTAYEKVIDRLQRENFITEIAAATLKKVEAAKTALEKADAGNKEALEQALKDADSLLASNANAAFANKKAELAKKQAERDAFYNGFQNTHASIEHAGKKAYDETYQKVFDESKQAYEQLKKENNGQSVYDQEPNFDWTAKIAANKAQEEAKNAAKADADKKLGAYYRTLKSQEMAQIEQEAIDLAKQSPSRKYYNSFKALLGEKQIAPPPLELATRTPAFISHITHAYYRHISAIFGKGDGKGDSLLKDTKNIANDLDKLGQALASGNTTRAQAEEKVLEIKVQHAKKTEEINTHLDDLRSDLDAIEKRLSKVRTRDDFTKSLDTSAQRWMPFPAVSIKLLKLRPHQIPKYMPYWPGENIRDKERQALITFKSFLQDQITDIENIAANHTKWTKDAFDQVDSMIAKKADDGELASTIKKAHKAINSQVEALTHRVGKGDPQIVTMDENSVTKDVTLKDRMFVTVESKNVDYSDWLVRSIRESYANPYQRTTPIQRPKDVYQNAEKLSWQIEKFWRGRDSVQPSDAKSLAGHLYNLYTVGMEQEAMYAMRHLGYAFGRSEKIHNVKDLSQHNYLPADIIPEIRNLHTHADDPHFSYFLQTLKTTQEKAMGGHHPGPVLQGGQRAIEKMYNDITFWPRYAFRHRGDGMLAVPGTEHYLVEPARGWASRMINWDYRLGKALDDEKTRANRDADWALYKYEFKDDGWSWWKSPLRATWRIADDLVISPVYTFEKYASLGAISPVGMKFAGVAGGLWGAENTMEYFLDTDLPDTGASLLGAQLALIDNTSMSLGRSVMGWVGLEEHAHYLDLEKNGLREFVRTKVGDAEPTTLSPEENARKLIHRLTYDTATGKPDTSHPLFMDRHTPGYLSAVNTIAGKLKDGALAQEGQTESEAVAKIIRDTKTHEADEAKRRAAALIHSLSATGLLKKESDPNHALYLAPGTSAHDEAVKQIVEQNRPLTTGEAEDIVRKIKGTQIQDQASDPNLKNASHQQDPAAAPAATTPAATTPPATAPAATVPPATVPPATSPQATTPAVSRTSAPPAPISTRSLGESWDSLASLPGRGLKAAYTFDGEMPREIEDVLNVGGSFLSGAFSLAGGLLSDLYNEKIEGGRWWLGAGAGVIGATIAGQLAKQIPIIKHIPFIGIIGAIFAFPLVMRFTKGLLDGTITRQGGDKSYAPIVTSSVSSANPAGVFPGPAPAVSSVSHTGGAPVEKVLWEDKDNKHAIINKITAKDPDGAGPKKFSVQVHNDDGSTHASLDVLKDWQGQGQAPVFISRESLTAMGLSKESFEYEAISHKDVNTQEDTPFISLRFMDNAKQTLQSVFIGAPNDFVPQP